MFKFNKSHFKSQAHQFQLLRWIYSTSFLRFSVLRWTRWFYLLIQCWQEPWWLLVLGEKDRLRYLGARNQRDCDRSKEILSVPAMGLNVLNELRKFLVEHVFSRLIAIYACGTCVLRKTNKQRIAAFAGYWEPFGWGVARMKILVRSLMSFPIGYYSMSGEINECFRHVTGQYASLGSEG